jgi:hypothetical protein
VASLRRQIYPGGVDQDRDRQSDAELLHVECAQSGEDREHADHHRDRTGHHAGRAGDAVGNGL